MVNLTSPDPSLARRGIFTAEVNGNKLLYQSNKSNLYLDENQEWYE
jgi:hypothetical protein